MIVLNRPKDMAEEITCLFLSLFIKQVFHIRRQTTDIFKFEVETVFAYELVSRCIIKVFGR